MKEKNGKVAASHSLKVPSAFEYIAVSLIILVTIRSDSDEIKLPSFAWSMKTAGWRCKHSKNLQAFGVKGHMCKKELARGKPLCLLMSWMQN